MMKWMRFVLPAMLLLGATALWAATRRERLLDQHRQVQLEMAETRQRLLREKDELRELHERIRSLQLVLARRLDEQPEMAALRQRLAAIEQELAATPAD